MCEWICVQGPDFKLTSSPHLFPNGFLRDTKAWENKCRNGSHRGLALSFTSGINPPQLHYKCVTCEGPTYNTTTYFPIFLGKRYQIYCKSEESPCFSPSCNQRHAGVSLWCEQILTRYHVPAVVNCHRASM